MTFLRRAAVFAQALSFFPAGLSRYQRRLGAFIAISFALHLLTAVGFGPFDLSGRGPAEARGRTELHARLAPAESRPAETPAAAPGAAPDRAPEAAARETPPPQPPAETGGLSLPAAEPWYTASEVDVRAEPVTRVSLRYPENARAELAVSTVRLRLFIDERGVVRKIQIAQSGPSAVFDEAARRAWEDVRFTPALKDGAPVRSQKLIELTYTAGTQ
jgi:TonB family protein